MNSGLEARRSAGYMTNWAARLFARAIDRRLKPLGLSAGQLPVLFALAGGGPLTQKALATFASIEQPTMAATLARMERDGLIERKADPADGRSALVELSPLGRAQLPAVREAVDAVNAEALSLVEPAEREACLAVLSRIIEALSAE